MGPAITDAQARAYLDANVFVAAFEHVGAHFDRRGRLSAEAEIMNKIIKKHYPIERLPADLRSGLQEHGWVHIEIEPERGTPLRTKLSLLVASGKNVHGDAKAVLSEIRTLREDR